MTAFLHIVWFIGFMMSIFFVFETIGINALTNMFPEGKRWWHFPAQIASLVFFSVMVLYNPFTMVMK